MVNNPQAADKTPEGGALPQDGHAMQKLIRRSMRSLSKGLESSSQRSRRPPAILDLSASEDALGGCQLSILDSDGNVIIIALSSVIKLGGLQTAGSSELSVYQSNGATSLKRAQSRNSSVAYVDPNVQQYISQIFLQAQDLVLHAHLVIPNFTKSVVAGMATDYLTL